MTYPLVAELAAAGVPVTVSCPVLKLARQPYYRWRSDPVRDADVLRAHRINALHDAHHDDAGIKALARSPHLARLRSLSLDTTEIHSAGAQALLESSHLGRIRYLTMRNAYITSSEREQLRACYGAGTRF